MITIGVDDLAPRDAYRLLVSLVVPRPIGWVSTIGADGARNLAPFSFFNAVGGPPPTVMVSVGERRGAEKDTLRNVRETGEMVVHMVDEGLAAQANHSSGEWAYEVDEFDAAELAAIASDFVRPPRLRDAVAAMECLVKQFVQVEDTSYVMILGKVVRFHLRDGLLAPDGLVDAAAMRPVARLGRDDYTTLGEIFTMLRPSGYPR